MSNPDSFIEEVTEEVRRDRLFKLFRKYGWIGGLAVIGIVGGAAWNEWSKSRAEARAQAFGDAIVDALDTGTPEERRAALGAVPSDGAQTALLELVLSSDSQGDMAENLAALDKVAADTTLSPAYRDLAVLRRVLLAGTDVALADRRTICGVSTATCGATSRRSRGRLRHSTRQSRSTRRAIASRASVATQRALRLPNTGSSRARFRSRTSAVVALRAVRSRRCK